MSVIAEALRASASGLSVIPIIKGTKRAAVKWEVHQTRAMDEAQIKAVFLEEHGMAYICGAVSKGLEVIDFDVPGKVGKPPAYRPFLNLCKEHGFEDLIKRLVIVQTPSGGMHLIYRCAEIAGNQKLAMTKGNQVLIETRGEGGYFLTCPTPGYVVRQGDIFDIPTITADERESLLTCAAHLTEKPVTESVANHQSATNIKRPGDAYAAATTWHDILEPLGWKQVGRSGSRLTWVRPGKDARAGISATTGNGDNDLLYVHTSNAHPFNAQTLYSKFAAYAELEWKGDYHMAAQALAKVYAPAKQPAPLPKPVEPYQSAPKPVLTELAQLLADTDIYDPDGFDEVEPEHYWDPYLLKAVPIFCDGDSGIGKTTFIATVLALVTQGIMPFSSRRIEPVKFIYLHTFENPIDEIKTVYKRCGGIKGSMILPPENWMDSLHLEREDDRELLAEYAKAVGAEIIVADPFYNFMHARDINDPNEALEKMRPLARWCSKHKILLWGIRHTKKTGGQWGGDVKELASGANNWNAKARGVLVIRKHPTIYNYVVMQDGKGTLLNRQGPTLVFERKGNRFEIVPDAEDPFKKENSVPVHEGPNARAWILTALTHDWMNGRKLLQMASEAGIAQKTFERARLALKEEGLILRGGAGENTVWCRATVQGYNHWEDE